LDLLVKENCQLEKEQSTVQTQLSMIIGDMARADELVKGIEELKALESSYARTKDAETRAKADALQARLEQIVIDSRARAGGRAGGRRRRGVVRRTRVDAACVPARGVGALCARRERACACSDG
jgi:hypothetical protein